MHQGSFVFAILCAIFCFGLHGQASASRKLANENPVVHCAQSIKALDLEEEDFVKLGYGKCEKGSLPENSAEFFRCAVDYKKTTGAISKHALSACSNSAALRDDTARAEIFGCTTEIETRLKIDLLDRDDRDHSIKTDDPSIGEVLARVCMSPKTRKSTRELISCVQEASKTKARLSYLVLSCRDPVIWRHRKEFVSCVAAYTSSLNDVLKGDRPFFDPHCSNDKDWKAVPQVQKCVPYFQRYLDSRNIDISKARAADVLQSCLSEPSQTQFAEVRKCIDSVTKLGVTSEEDYWEVIQFCRTNDGLENYKKVTECLTGLSFPTGAFSRAVKRCVDEWL
jgi:hypothetical protein